MNDKQLASYLSNLRMLHGHYVNLIIDNLKKDGLDYDKYIRPLFFFEYETLDKEIDKLNGDDIPKRLRHFIKEEIFKSHLTKEGKNE